ncbi:DUF4141 domain-containing protein [Bacteroides caccae]|jgi:hypothetical protein|uniref:DUF4141 domain-containing protein n=1 Tax=Bacteroides thetaiotaomicron TaxID=818 RepID=A0A414HRB8_BACT4|nr:MULTISPECIES: DUF4141 domain-containing protein [Bacteroidaceae]DAQ40242.1 MAG TPA: protein of unknown function (DUF4141) [Caudoviricetes sp.]MCR2007043.1 DUF4141 domain-containing protein [Bacteroides acidifaciens]MCS2367233.1 DUF4141 domain-containing protein [Bacteroides caccae]MCS3191694.1 DUF4141 domain-containing protein [Bacteroides caccae]MCS3198636.1 DUF4141 domain-containing protein [Bacteroides thetaiotaomicron]
MKKYILIICIGLLCFAHESKAQWVVTDPGNLAQGIINTTKQIIQTSTTANNTLNGFKETAKVFEQGKKYYDALKSVHNLVKDARKVQQTVLLVGDISELYVKNYQKMLSDPNFTPAELNAIAFGYTKLLEESNGLLVELKTVVSANGLSMSDKERMDVIDRVYRDVKEYRNLVAYYTNRNIAVSYLRAKEKNDAKRVLSLYGSANERYW